MSFKPLKYKGLGKRPPDLSRLFCVFGFIRVGRKFERRRINAVSKSCWLWAIIEYVAEMSATFAADDLGSLR